MMTASYIAKWASEALPDWDVDLLIDQRSPEDWGELVNWYVPRSSLRRNE